MTGSKIQRLEELVVWQKAHALTLEVYRVTDRFPSHEQFGLTSQLRRASVSVSANIAEGFARGTREFIHFLVIAQGSLEESRYFFLLAKDLGYVSPTEYETLNARGEEVGRMLHGLMASLKKRSVRM